MLCRIASRTVWTITEGVAGDRHSIRSESVQFVELVKQIINAPIACASVKQWGRSVAGHAR